MGVPQGADAAVVLGYGFRDEDGLDASQYTKLSLDKSFGCEFLQGGDADPQGFHVGIAFFFGCAAGQQTGA